MKDTVVAIIASQCKKQPDSLREETTLVGDLGVDSLDVVEIIMALEDKFHISISTDEAMGFIVIGDIIKHVQAKKGA